MAVGSWPTDSTNLGCEPGEGGDGGLVALSVVEAELGAGPDVAAGKEEEPRLPVQGDLRVGCEEREVRDE